jgi:hypothetical protein
VSTEDRLRSLGGHQRPQLPAQRPAQPSHWRRCRGMISPR